jgi:hypothetical protein
LWAIATVEFGVHGNGDGKREEAGDEHDGDSEGLMIERRKKLGEEGYQKVGGEGDAIEDADDSQESEAGAFLEIDEVGVVGQATDENQRPQDDDGLDAVGEGVGLQGPSNVRGGDEHDGNATLVDSRDEFVNGPITQDETDEEHDGPQTVKGGARRHGAVAETLPDPFENGQRPTVDQPEGEDAADGMGRGEFPRLVDGIPEDFAYRWRQYIIFEERRGF